MLSSIANKRKVEEATSHKDDVAPVYLLEEIWQLVSSSGQDTALGMVDFINRRLANKSPIVKQKTLRLIKFLCGKGASDFKRGISKQAGTVRELTHYKGDPDPFKGDTPNQKVRDMAKEAVEAIFAPTETPSYTAPSTSGLQSRIQGFGSAAAPDTAPGGGASRGRAGMLGFANSWSDNKNPSRSSSSKGFGKRGGYEGPGEASKSAMMGAGALSPKGIFQSISAKGGGLMQGRRGQGFLNTEERAGYSSDEADRGYDQPGPNPTQQPSSLAPRLKENGSHLRSTGGDAARLVNQICTPGGLRPQPSREDLRIFVESVGSQNGQEVAELLEEKIADPSRQAAVRALSALEAVIQQGSSVPCGEVAIFFQTNPGALEDALTSQASVRQRALRVLQLLGIESSAAQTSSSSAPKPSGNPEPDLLGGLTDNDAAQGSQDAQPGSSADMLGDLLGPGPSAAAPESGGMFSGLDFSSSQAPAQTQAETDFFGGSAPQNTAPPAPLQANASNADPFGDFQSTSDSQQKAEPLSDLFGGLSMGQNAQQSQASAGGGDLLAGLETPNPAGTASRGGAQAPNGSLDDMFAGMNTGGGANSAMQPTAEAGLSSDGPPRPLSSLRLASQRAASMEKHADPLASVGLPQPQHAPMGQGSSAQRGTPPSASMPGFPAQQQVGQMGMGFPQGQMTPQQIQYIRQMQYMQYMQMQAMQARAMGGGAPQPSMMFPQGQGQMQGFQPPAFQPGPQASGQGAQGFGGSGPISLDALAGPSPAPGNPSSGLGIAKQSDFDFVNDHVKGLRGKR